MPNSTMSSTSTVVRPTVPPARQSPRAFIAAWWPAALGVCVIALESTLIFTANNTGHILRPLWQAIFGPVSDQAWETFHHYIRKSGHFTGYGTLSLLFLRGWLRTLRLEPRETLARFRFQAAALAILCTFLTASADEFHQTFLPGRTGLFSDVLLDTAGGLTAHLLFWVFVWGSSRRRPS